MKFQNTAEKDRYYICEIGRLFWEDNKQCYDSSAVYHEAKKRLQAHKPIKRMLNSRASFANCGNDIEAQTMEADLLFAILEKLEEIRCGIIDVEEAVKL